MRLRAFLSASDHSKAWTLTDELKPEDIERLRAVLPKPLHERFDFAYTMNRWEELVSSPTDMIRIKRFEPPSKWLTEDGADLVEVLTGKLPQPRRKRRQGKPRPPPDNVGRPRVDQERYAALLLGFIFHEFTGARPTRPAWDDYAEKETISSFFQFATDAFEAIGLKPRTEAFRDTCEAWKNPTDEIEFSREAIEKLLWGGLVPDD